MDGDSLEDIAQPLRKGRRLPVDGETALLLVVKEENETALEDKLHHFQYSITRLDAEEIEAEIGQEG